MARTTPVNSGYTIINGSTTGSNGSKVDTWLEYKVTSQSVANNTSTVRVVLYSAATFSSSTKWESASQFGYVGYNNGNKFYLSTTYNFANYAVNKFGDHTYTIQHNSDGTKTVTLQGSWSTSHSTYISGGSASGSVSLPQIARASSVSAMSTKLGSVGTITITRQSSSFTHTLTYAFGNTTGTIATKTSNTSVSWIPPVSLISQITNATSGTGTITCETFSGNTSLGTSTSVLTLSVPNSTMADVSGEIGTSVPFTVTNDVTSQLTFTITYTFGNVTGTIQTKGSRTGTYLFPSSLISQIDNASSGTGTISVVTFNGNAQIGTASAILTLRTPTYKATAVTGTIGSALTINLTRPNATLTVTITYAFGGATGNIATQESITSKSWTPPTSLIDEIPNSDNGGGTITLTTYNGTINCGSNTYALTLSVPSSVVPTSTFTTYIVNSNSTINGWGVAVQGYSQIRGVISASGVHSSTIKALSISGQGLTTSSNPNTATASLDQTSSIMSVAGNMTYKANATDSRNRSATEKSSTITIYPYAIPSVTELSIIRVDANGNPDTAGRYFGITFDASYSPVNGHNPCTIKLQYKENTASTWQTDNTSLVSEQLNIIDIPDESKNYNTRLFIQDALNITYSVVINVASAERVLNINQYGDGLAIGGFSTLRDFFQVYYQSRFVRDVTMLGDLSVDGGLSVNGDVTFGDITGSDITGDSLTINGLNMLNGLVYKGTLTNANNLNDIEESGIYYITNSIPTNAPPTARTYTYVLSLTAMISANTVRQQIYIRPIVTQGASSLSLRTYSGGAWSEWKTINDLPFCKGINEITSYTNLNDYSFPGVYFCNTTAIAKSLDNTPYTEGIWDGSNGFRLEVINTTGTNYCLQKIYTHNVKPRVFYRTQNNGKWYPWYREPWENEIYYNNRETQTLKNYDCGGYLTNGTKRIRFSIPMAKSMANVTPVLRTLKINVWRSDGGYTLASSYTTGGYDVLADANMTASCSKGADNLLRIQVDKTSVFNGTNNTPIGVEINQCEVSFGESATITPLSAVPISGIKQGACSDGTYLYQVSATNDYGTMTFIKYKISDGTYTTTVFTGENLGHANDLTYNPNDGNIYIATSNADFPVVVMKASNMTILRTIMIQDANGNVYAPYMICYDRTHSRFYTQCNNDLLIYDNNMNYVSSVPLTTLPEGTQQTMETDGTYIYRMVYNPNFVQVSDLSGNNEDLFQIPMTGEPEGIMYDWNGNWYVSCNTSGDVFYSMTMP